MKSDAPNPRPTEIELKLAVPTQDPSRLVQRLSKTALLSRKKASIRHLHNVYYDTPDQVLHQARIALRLRRVGSDQNPQWLQTLKMGGASDSALSQRGEWEVAVPNGALDFHALEATPWSQIDPDGHIFQALAPCFTTSFERSSWLVRGPDGSSVEVALDVGQIVACGHSAPLCELEFELLSGTPDALFDTAQAIANTIAVLPANTSKAERGYALAQNTWDRPVRARPPELGRELALHEAAGRVLREMFSQFTSNLHVLCTSDAPEVVHQARVGWRRFKSALRLFKPALPTQANPPWLALGPFLSDLGTLRDLEVALNETLPPFLEAYAQGDAQRVQSFETMLSTLSAAADRQRKSVRIALQTPATGLALLATTQWLEALTKPPVPDHTTTEAPMPLRPWARRRIARLRQRMKEATQDAHGAQDQHRIRIFAKRLRYGIEALQPLLWKRRAQRWHQKATALQTSIGTARDITQAGALAATLRVDPGLVEFLRGLAVGRETSSVPVLEGLGVKLSPVLRSGQPKVVATRRTRQKVQQ
ncbi:MAG: CHAD domain-containing protein [Rhodoferax sp.]|nr:CYTH and CHAD domain-containing protein [Rhodoferax sp.]MDP3654249.1 CHAD domain-containing protein [Rhodoferax sp.]